MTRSISRRGAMKGAMKVGAYTASAILSVSMAESVGAVSPAPASPTVTFAPSGQNEVVTGAGFPSGIFLLIFYNAKGEQLGLNFPQIILTVGASGSWTLTTPADPGIFTRQGSVAATVNGGNIFVLYDNVK